MTNSSCEPPTIDAAEIRAEMARHKILIYEIAPLVPLHPRRLGPILNGRQPLTPQLADQIQRAIQVTVTSRASA